MSCMLNRFRQSVMRPFLSSCLNTLSVLLRFTQCNLNHFFIVLFRFFTLRRFTKNTLRFFISPFHHARMPCERIEPGRHLRSYCRLTRAKLFFGVFDSQGIRWLSLSGFMLWTWSGLKSSAWWCIFSLAFLILLLFILRPWSFPLPRLLFEGVDLLSEPGRLDLQH